MDNKQGKSPEEGYNKNTARAIASGNSGSGNLESPPRAAEDPDNERFAEINTRQDITGDELMSADFNREPAECGPECEKLIEEGFGW